MNSIKETWNKFHRWVNGFPNEYLTIALILTAVFGILVALHAPAEFKVLLLAYWWFP